jgi:hypothetical protein
MAKLMGFVGLFAVVAAGCTSGPTDEDYDDVAASVAALTASDSGGDVGAMGDAVEASQGQEPEGVTNSGSGSFTGARGGLEYEYALTCSSATGDLLETCDDTTDTAHLTVAWSGELHLARYDATLSRTGDWTLSGLQGDVVTLNGVGSFDADSSFQALFRDETRTLRLAYDASYDAVQISKSIGRPVGGTASFAVHMERTRSRGARDVEAEFDIDAVVTFANDGTAHLELDGERSYVVNLDDGSVTSE